MSYAHEHGLYVDFLRLSQKTAIIYQLSINRFFLIVILVHLVTLELKF